MNRRELQIYSVAMAQYRYPVDIRLAAAAITLAEMRFRMFPHRVLENVLVLALIAACRDPGHISIGISQISLRHFSRILGVSSLAALRGSTSAETNLHTCCALISEYSTSNISEILSNYNGRSSIFYKKAIADTYSRLHDFHRATNRQQTTIG